MNLRKDHYRLDAPKGCCLSLVLLCEKEEGTEPPHGGVRSGLAACLALWSLRWPGLVSVKEAKLACGDPLVLPSPGGGGGEESQSLLCAGAV